MRFGDRHATARPRSPFDISFFNGTVYHIASSIFSCCTADISKAYSAHSESEVLGQQIRVEHCSWIPGPKWDDRLGHAVLKLFYPEHAVGCTWVDHPEINLSPESQTRSMSRLYYHPIGDSPVGRTAVCSTSHWYLRSFKPKVRVGSSIDVPVCILARRG